MFVHYPPDIYLTQWGKFESLVESQNLVSILPVYYELVKYEDGIKKWATDHKDLFTPLTEAIVENTKEIVNKQKYILKYGNHNDQADPYLLGYSKASGHTILSNDKGLKGFSKEFKVSCIDLLELIKQENWTF